MAPGRDLRDRRDRCSPEWRVRYVGFWCATSRVEVPPRRLLEYQDDRARISGVLAGPVYARHVEAARRRLGLKGLVSRDGIRHNGHPPQVPP